MTVAALQRLWYWYPQAAEAALAGVSLELDVPLLALTGDSGSGKSTLLRLLNGLVPHFHGGRIAGAARVLGHDVLRTPTRVLARSVGFVFQDPELQSVYATVERDVAFGLENAGVPRAEMHHRVDEALQRTGIAHLRRRELASLSGGERQRCALAGVLALRPQLLALDEPLSQLDSGGAAALLADLRRLGDSGTGVVVAEQHREAVRGFCDAALHLDRGRIVAAPPPAAAVPSRERAIAAGGEDAFSLRAVHAGPGREPLLHGLDLSARGGEVLAITGNNGAGKTTLLRTLAGLLAPHSGAVWRRPGRVAYLPQNPAALLHRPTVRAEIAWTLRHDPGPDGVDEVLRQHRLSHLAARYPRDLSSGERQRVALAAVLAGAPALALLDEPTRGMDEAARASLVRGIERLCRRGCAVVVATHDQNLVAAVADRRLHLAAATAEAVPAAVEVPA